MKVTPIFYRCICYIVASFLLLVSHPALSTTVQFQTSLGDIEVNLYDQATPETVANFLAYVDSGSYANTIVHRSVRDFIVQGGGFTLIDKKIDRVPTLLSPVNEPVYSNVRGTIAMAKLGGDPDSATNQWFFNLADNSSNLDVQNGGFTVFGEVVSGVDIIEAMGQLVVGDLRGEALEDVFVELQYQPAFSSTPLRDITDVDEAGFMAAPEEHLVMISDIVVLDASVDTAANLSPVANTLIIPDEPTPEEPTPEEPTPVEPAPVEPITSIKSKNKFLGRTDFMLLMLLIFTGCIQIYRRRT